MTAHSESQPVSAPSDIGQTGTVNSVQGPLDAKNVLIPIAGQPISVTRKAVQEGQANQIMQVIGIAHSTVEGNSCVRELAVW